MLSGLLVAVALASTLAIGVPLFLRTPLWADVSLYDISAWNVLRGGTHYRDTFDTNLPGMVLVHCLVRSAVGWSSEAMRTVDLVVCGGIVALLASFLRQAGIGRIGRVWFAVTALVFYLFESEFIHCQRDVWMLFYLLAAVVLYAFPPAAVGGRAFPRGAAIGLLIALALWTKPHTFVPAACTYGWLRWRGGALLGAKAPFWAIAPAAALASGAVGLWLVASGTLGPMIAVFRDWNPEYYDWSREAYELRWERFWPALGPFSRFHAFAAPLALAAMAAECWGKPSRSRYARSALGMLYLSWVAQSLLLQKPFDYVFAPGIFLALAVIASFAGAWIGLVVAWCFLGSLAGQLDGSTALGRELREWDRTSPNYYCAFLPNHRIFDCGRLALWSECFRADMPKAERDMLPLFRGCNAVPSVRDQAAVVAFLKTLDLKPGELVCWDDATHPIYREVGLKPGIRYLHVHTALRFASKRDTIRDELRAAAPKYAVADIALMPGFYGFSPDEFTNVRLEVPDTIDCYGRAVFPWDQTVVFRSGRYVVMKVDQPIDLIWWDEWD